MKKFVLSGMALLAGAALCAQEGWEYRLKGGIVSAQEDLVRLTREHNGIFGEISARKALNAEGLALNFHGGHLAVYRKVVDVPATDPGSDTADAKNSYIGLDISYPVTSGFRLYTGPTLNVWDIVAKTAGKRPDSSVKFGWRGGASYAFLERWAVDVSYSVSEWTRYQPRLAETTPNQQVRRNPTWVSIGVSYKF